MPPGEHYNLRLGWRRIKRIAFGSFKAKTGKLTLPLQELHDLRGLRCAFGSFKFAMGRIRPGADLKFCAHRGFVFADTLKPEARPKPKQECLSAGTAAAIVLRERMSLIELKQEVLRLTPSERLQTMEWLWSAVSGDDQQVESPEWHGKVLEQRQARANSSDAHFLGVPDLKKRLHR